jgi:hypothetical protein
MSSIEIKRKMMKLYRRELLKEVYSTLLKKRRKELDHHLK